MNQSEQTLLNNLIANYGTWASYQSAIAALPEFVQSALRTSPDDGGFAVPLLVLDAFREGYNGAEVIQPTPEASARPSKGVATVSIHNLLKEPVLLHPEANATYIGRANPRQGFNRTSILANVFRMKGDSQLERDRVCDQDLQRLIRTLESRKGDRWDEIKRLSLVARKGEPVKLLCYCKPHRCHGDALCIAIQGLAERRKVPEIIQELQALLPAEQKTLLGAAR